MYFSRSGHSPRQVNQPGVGLSFDLLLAWALVCPTTGPLPRVGEEVPRAATSRNYATEEGFLVVPVRVHVLESEELPEAACTLEDHDLDRILGKVNRVWHQAGIYFGVESVVKEPVAGVGRYKVLRRLSDGELPLGVYSEWLPMESRSRGMLHVYYVHELPVNGVYLGDGAALVKETARLNEVPGGLDEALPRVTSHELGHALTLEHQKDRNQLMASGTTGFTLSSEEIDRARRATPGWGVQRLEDLRKLATEQETLGQSKKALRLRKWLAEVEASMSSPTWAREAIPPTSMR